MKPIAVTIAQPRASLAIRVMAAMLAFVRTAEPAERLPVRASFLFRANGQLRELPATYDESPNLSDWAQIRVACTFVEARGTRSLSIRCPLMVRPAARITSSKGRLVSASVELDAEHTLALPASRRMSRLKVYVMPAAGGEPARVSAANQDLELPPLGETRLVQWKSKDGQDVEGLLTLPAGYEKGRECR